MKKIIAISLLMVMMCFALFACQLRTIDSKDSEENTSAEDTDTNGIPQDNPSEETTSEEGIPEEVPGDEVTE